MHGTDNPNLAELIRDRARERPDAVAVRFPDPKASGAAARWEALSFADIDRGADSYAHGFRRAGIAPGDRALLLIKPTAEFYAVVFGLIRCGAVPVFIDPGMGAKAALRCVQDIAPRTMVAAPPVHLARCVVRTPFRSVQVAVRDGWGIGGTTTLAACKTHDLGPFEPPKTLPEEDAVIVFTSGSTGPAKGVALSHACMRARVAQIGDLFGLQPGSSIVETLLVYTVLEICMGLSVVVPPMDLSRPATVDPADVVETIRRFDPEVASASPVVWQRLVRYAQSEGIRLDQIGLLLTTAAPIPVDLHERLGDVFASGVELFTPYGATEAMPVARIGSAEILAHAAAATATGAGTCVGSPSPHMEVRVVDLIDDPIHTESEFVDCAPGEVGEIVVRGASVSQTYRASSHGNERAKVSTPEGVWHRMGDLGTFDAEGRLWFCGRVAHRIEAKQGRIAVVPVEGIYNQHPDVYRSALVGLGPAGTEVPVLCVEMEAGRPWSDEVARSLRALATGTRFEDTVARFLPHPGFPTDTRHNSKIRREELKAWAEQQAPDLLPS